LTASTHKQQTEEIDKQAVEQEAHGKIAPIGDAAHTGGEQRGSCWETLVPVLVPVFVKLERKVKCIKCVNGL